jgi:putative ABC transport system permease protein
MNTLVADVLFGSRMLAKSAGVTLMAVLSLALGIGANTAIFTLINALFLRPLAVHQPERLVSLFVTDAKNEGHLFLSRLNYEDIRDRNQHFSGAALYGGIGLNLSGGEEPEQIIGEIASGNYFEVLGVRPALGRTFAPEEDAKPGASPVVVLSHGFWTRRLASRPDVTGTTITLNRRPFTVIGVMPVDFHGINPGGGPELWVPAAMWREVHPRPADYLARRTLMFQAIARLKPGVTVEQAQSGITGIARDLEREFPADNEGRGIRLVPASQAVIHPDFRGNLIRVGGLLMTVVGLVLLIACANVANLLLARASGRQKEVAIRLSLGAGRGRLVRQLMTESALLAAAGGAFGLLFAGWIRTLIWWLRPPQVPANAMDLSLSPPVLLFTLVLALATSVLFGLAPALKAARLDLAVQLRDKTGRPSRSGRWSLRNALVVAQVALSMVALIGAGLFVRSLLNAQQASPGFDTRQLAILTFNVGSQGYSQERGLEFYRQVRERARAVPGVRQAALASNLPIAGGGFMRSVFVEGQEQTPGRRGVLVLTNIVTPEYFETLGIPVLRGRAFAATDNTGAPRAVVVNQTMARRFWPGQDAVGKRFHFFGFTEFFHVVGVARDAKYGTLFENPRPAAYLALEQMYSPAMTLQIRSTIDPAAALAAVRREVQQMDRNLPLTNVATARELVARTLWASRMGAGLLTAFGVLALLLAAVGLYGVMSYSVSQRTQEIGVRIALGARPGNVVRMVMRQGLALIGFGLVAGIALAVALTRLIAQMLFGLSATDPLTFAATSLVLALVAAAAAFVPARRATRVDPVIALRYE